MRRIKYEDLNKSPSVVAGRSPTPAETRAAQAREVLLRRLEGQTLDMISDEMRLSVTTVARRMQYALNRQIQGEPLSSHRDVAELRHEANRRMLIDMLDRLRDDGGVIPRAAVPLALKILGEMRATEQARAALLGLNVQPKVYQEIEHSLKNGQQFALPAA